MKDIQNQVDTRRINIQKVGVKQLSYPIILRDKSHLRQNTVATVSMYVNLPHHFKGTHMSRFIEILNDYHGDFTLKVCNDILSRMKEKLEAQAAHLEIGFPFFIQRKKEEYPGSRCYDCVMRGSLDDDQNSSDLMLELKIPWLRKQRASQSVLVPDFYYCDVLLKVKFNHFIWIEDLIMLVEKAMDGLDVEENIGHETGVEKIHDAVHGVIQEEKALSWFEISVEKKNSGYTTFTKSNL